MHQWSRFIIHIYTCSLWNIYTFTLFIYVLLLIYSPHGCVSHLCGQICLLCIFTIIIFIFFPTHLVEKSSRELLMEAGGKEKESEGPSNKLFKDFLLLDLYWPVCRYSNLLALSPMALTSQTKITGSLDSTSVKFSWYSFIITSSLLIPCLFMLMCLWQLLESSCP